MILSHRLTLLRGAIAGPDVRALAGVFRLPTSLVVKRWIRHIEPGEDYMKVYLKGIKRPLSWPANYPVRDLHEVVAECFNGRNWHHYEVAETTVEPGMTVLDCGAAEGIFALSVESRAARVYAFEPKPEFLSALSATFDDSAVVEPVPKALSDREGTGSLGSEALWSHVVVGDGDVRITTVDAWARGRQVDFIKADVEGMEYALLRGAEETILRYKPRIAITTYHIGNDATRMVELLRHIVPSYQVRTKGTSYNARVRRPIMLHAWV